VVRRLVQGIEELNEGAGPKQGLQRCVGKAEVPRSQTPAAQRGLVPPRPGPAFLVTLPQYCDPPRQAPWMELESLRSSPHCARDLLVQGLLL